MKGGKEKGVSPSLFVYVLQHKNVQIIKKRLYLIIIRAHIRVKICTIQRKILILHAFLAAKQCYMYKKS